MKYRNSFVTNSSSSSYIIGLKKEENDLPQDIKDILLEWAKMEILENQINTIEELNDYFIKNNCYIRKDITIEELLESKSYIKKEYEDLKSKIENGYTIYTNSICCECEDNGVLMISDLFDMLKQSKNYIPIDTDLNY